MFERFTDDARRVVVLAQEEARELGHDYIGTEHLLLGLVRDEDGVGSRALEACGVTLDQVRRDVVELVGEGAGAPSGHVPFTPRGKKVLELSLREALQLGHNYIGSEHILLGIIREGEGVAARVLEKLGVTLGGLRQEVIQILAGYTAAGVEEPGEQPDPGPRAVAGWTGSIPGGPLRRFGRRRRPGPQPPACSTCGGELAETAAFRILRVRAEEGDETRDVVVVYCTHCGTTIAGRVGGDIHGDPETGE
jgi:ATP-dependent Clp protease ATP-binding subunit ClpA